MAGHLAAADTTVGCNTRSGTPPELGSTAGFRFTDPAACSGDVCSTTVVHYSDRTGWRQVFSRRTKAISTGGPSAHPNGDVLATLIADGGETWEFTGVRYEPVVDSLGVPFPAPKTASGAHAQAAAEMLKDSLPPASLNLPVQFTEAQLDIGARGGAALLLEVQGGYSCGQGGCPFVLAVPDGNALQPVLSWVTIDQGAVLRTSSHGLHDLALRDREGFAVYRYDGKSYRLAATSYPSAVTPAP